MKANYSAFAVAALVLGVQAGHGYRHKAFDVNRRQAGSPIMGPPPSVATMGPAMSLSSGVLTLITPSPGAAPVAVTQQSQIVTSYVPQFTLCELPPAAYWPVTPMPSASAVSAPYSNYSVSFPPGKGTCTTIYSSTDTMVCATTLTGLASKVPITNCAQDVTFSSQYGYELVTPTPSFGNMSSNATYANVTYPNATATITRGPSIETVTTYYLAPWKQLTAGTAPSNVIREVCSAVSNASYTGTECITAYQVWTTSLVTYTTTSTTLLNVSATISGPSQIIIEETIMGNVTNEMTTFSLMTTVETEYQTHYTTTQQSVVPVTTAPTVFETLSVEYASST